MNILIMVNRLFTLLLLVLCFSACKKKGNVENLTVDNYSDLLNPLNKCMFGSQHPSGTESYEVFLESIIGFDGSFSNPKDTQYPRPLSKDIVDVPHPFREDLGDINKNLIIRNVEKIETYINYS